MTSGRTVPRFEVIGITGIGEIVEGDRLADIIVSAARAQGTPLGDGDVLVVTQKVVSKAEGRTVDLGEVEPSPLALELASAADRDPGTSRWCSGRAGPSCGWTGTEASSSARRGTASCAPTRESMPRTCRAMTRNPASGGPGPLRARDSTAGEPTRPGRPSRGRHLRYARPSVARGPDKPRHRRGGDGAGSGLQGHTRRLGTRHEGVRHSGSGRACFRGGTRNGKGDRDPGGPGTGLRLRADRRCGLCARA